MNSSVVPDIHPASSGPATSPAVRWIAPLVFACLLFLVNHLDLLRAWLQPPAGTHPMFVARDPDIAQHLTWMNGLRDHWLLPDYHAAVTTSPALFVPLMIVLGHIAGIGLDAALLYTVAQFFVYLAGSFALFACGRVFLTSRLQMLAVLAGIFCVIPLGDFGRLVKIAAAGALRTESAIGVLERDGWILPGPLAQGFGTVSVIVALALVGAYIQNGRIIALIAAGMASGISALLHPFEALAIMAGATTSLVCLRWPRWRTAFREALAICAPVVAALSLYAWFSFRTPWVAEIARRNRFDLLDPVRLLYRLGLPALAALAILVIAPRMKRPSDVLLQCWFAATLAALMVPGVPFRLHLTDGLAVVTVLLAVRQFSTVPPLEKWIAGHRRLALAVGAAVLTVSFTTQALHRVVLFQTGNWLTGAVARDEEILTIDWLRRHARPEELVLAPPDSAAWLATVPIHSFAGHWLFSFDYAAQEQLAEAFYDGRMGAEESKAFLRRYGINYVAVPAASSVRQFLDPRQEAAQILTWTLYYFPGHHMAPYTAASSRP
jgi:hypothetical protein